MSEAAARLAELIAALEQELAPLQRAANEADWQLNVTGEQRWEEESTRLQTEIRSVLSRPEPYRVLREAAASDGVDPLLHRQAVVLANEHAPNQISKETIERMVRLESSLTGRFRRFRPPSKHRSRRAPSSFSSRWCRRASAGFPRARRTRWR